MKHEPEKPKNQRDWVEEMEVAGGDLLEHARKLIAQGNQRRVIIRNARNEALIEVPLTPAVVVVGVATVVSPMFAALGALAALFAKVKIEVVRVEEIDPDAETIELSGDDVTHISVEDD